MEITDKERRLFADRLVAHYAPYAEETVRFFEEAEEAENAEDEYDTCPKCGHVGHFGMWCPACGA